MHQFSAAVGLLSYIKWLPLPKNGFSECLIRNLFALMTGRVMPIYHGGTIPPTLPHKHLTMLLQQKRTNLFRSVHPCEARF